MYIVDASVVLKWFIREEDSHLAHKLREQFLDGQLDLAAPDLLLYEVAHVLLRKKGFSALDAKQAVELVSQLSITTSSLDLEAQVFRAIDLAAKTGASVYDSSYLVLALDLGWPLVTADRRLARAVGPQVDVQLLSAF